MSINEFADAIVGQLKIGGIEATYGFSVESNRTTPEQLDAIFKQMDQSVKARIAV